MDGWVPSLTGLDSTKQEDMLLFERSKATKSKPVKLEISCSVIFPPMVSVLWSIAIVIKSKNQMYFYKKKLTSHLFDVKQFSSPFGVKHRPSRFRFK